MQVSVFDRMEVVDRKRTADGFLATRGRVSRSGIYEYRRGELKLDGNPNDIVKIYRPEDSVFSDESMASAAHRPLTLNHPPCFVDSTNWKTYSVGHAGGKVRRDGEFLDIDMLLMDGPAIKAVEDGAELSPGYTASISMVPNQTPTGETYDGIMEGPYRFNHIAVLAGSTPNGRGGPQCRIGDAWPTEIIDAPSGKEKPVPKTIIVDAIPVKLDDEAAVEAVIAKLTDRATKAETSLADAQTASATAATVAAQALDAANAVVATHVAEIATLKSQVADAAITPEKLRDAAKSYALMSGKAKALGVTVTDAMSEADMMKAAVVAKLGDTAKDWTDAQFAASFNTLAAGIKVEAKDALFEALNDPNRVTIGDGRAEAMKARQEMIDGMINPAKAAA